MREDSTNKLNRSEISQIAEFGHNPSQLFDKPHIMFDEKINDVYKTVFDPLAEHQVKIVKN